MLACLGVPARTADDGDGRCGIGDEVHHCLHGVGAGGLCRTLDPLARAGRGLVAQHVFRQGKHDGAGTSGDSRGVGACHVFGDAIGGIDPRGPLGDGAEEGGEVDFLEAFAVAHARIDIAHEHDHRLRILHGDMDADAGIGRARTAGHESNTGPAGHRSVGARHHRDPAFLAAGHEIDGILPRQRIEHLQEAFAWYGEDTLAPLFDQAVDEQLGGGGGGARGHG